MDLLIEACVGVFALLFLLFNLLNARSKLEKGKTTTPPQPPGAWPVIGHLHLLRGRPFQQTVSAMADMYGPIFMLRLGKRRTLVVSSLEGVKDCFTTNDKALASHPSSAAGEYLGYNYAMLGNAPYGSYWRDMRKMMTVHLLSNRRLQSLNHIWDREIDVGVKELYRVWEQNGGRQVKVGMRKWFKDMTFRVVMLMVAGKQFSEYGELEVQFQRLIDRFFQYTTMFLPSDVLPLPRWVDWQGHKRGMKNVGEELDSVMSAYLEARRRKRRSGESKEVDEVFFDVMLSAMDNNAQYSEFEPDTIVKANCLGAILGGSDSTASTTTAALSFVLNNPHVLRKAQEELDTHVGKDRHVTEQDITNLVYLQAILKETLRLNPLGRFLPLHEAMEDCQIGGFHVPAGTCVLVNTGKMHRDPHVWSDPLAFQPERFLTKHADMDVRGLDFMYTPFGSGRRSCPGISLALQVMHLTLARLLHCFELRRPSDAAMDIDSLIVGHLKPTAADVLLVAPRLPHHLYE